MTDRKSARPEEKSQCALGLDAAVAADMLDRDPWDSEAQAFVEHAGSCSACGRAMQTWALLREAWRADVERDEQYTRAGSERRLAALWPRRTGVPWPSAVAATAAAAVVAAWIASPRRLPAPVPRETPGTQANAAVSTTNATPTPPPATVRSTRTLVAVRSCPACGGLVAGESMTEREDVVVPRGATLYLNWGVDAIALVDATSGVDVMGPAVVRAKKEEGDVALMLQSGTAQAHVVHGGEVATAFAVTRGTDSTWVVAARDRSTRIKVACGEVEVRTGAVREVVHAGETLDALADGRLVSPIVSVAEMTLPGSPLRRARALASPLEAGPTISVPEPQAVVDSERRKGDSDNAPGERRDLGQSSEEGRGRERASFELAELELARRNTEHARSLLAPLLDSVDPSLAGDAAFLLSGSMSTPRERLEVLDRYLAMPRPSPYSEQAQVERARALLESGQQAAARAILQTLRAEPNLPLVARAGLVRIERALHQASPSAP